MKTTDEMIQEILDNFDFEQMHKVMTFLNWKWYYDAVPTIEELKEIAKNLLNQTVKGINNFKGFNNLFCSSGGFRAIGKKDGEVIYLELLFECTSWNVNNKNYKED
jgi:hypothetical protein